MENDINMGMNDETSLTKKSKIPLVGIIAGVLLLVIIIAFAVLNSPKVMMGVLIGRTPKTVQEFFEAEKTEQPLFMTESHKSETKISMDGEDLGMDGDIDLELLTGYKNSTGEFAAEMEIGMGDLDAVTAGLYLDQSEIAFISSVLSNKYVIDLESEQELGKNTTFEERLRTLLLSSDDEKFNDLYARLEDKILELSKFGIRNLPRVAMEKGKDSIEIFGEDQNITYVEAVMDEDNFKEWAEIVLEKVAEDDELEDLIVEIAEYINDEFNLDEEIDVDEIDLEDYCGDLLDELEDIEAEVSFRIYRKGFMPVAYEVTYEDNYSEGEALMLLYRSGKKLQMLLDGDIDGDEIYYNVYTDDDNFQSIKYEFDDMKYEVTIEEVKGIYKIDGDFDYGYMVKGTIEGEYEKSKNEDVFEMTVEAEDSYGTKTEIEYEGSILRDSSVTTTEISADVVVDDEDTAKIEIEFETEEVKKNKEYASEGNVEITDAYLDESYVIEFENSTIFGDEVELDLPSWSKNDVYAKASDDEKLQELFNSLGEDFESGYMDLISLLLYGGMY